MNKQRKCLTFTSEAENDSSFLSLGVKINRHNQQFKTSVYKKSVFGGAFMNYISCLDLTFKKSLIDVLLFRCFSISFGL